MRSARVSVETSQHQAWEAHVRDVVESVEITDVLMDHLVAGIASYCRQFHPRGLQTNDLRLLVARALCAVGADTAAITQVLEKMEPHRRHAGRWLEVLSELHHFPKLLPYFSLGIIRPADWAGARLDRMWTLDFGRLVLMDADRHEMVLYRTIRVMLENMYGFWDATSGEGTLGIKGLAWFNVVAGEKSITGSAELLSYMEQLLRQQLERRPWSTIPTVLNLDL